MRPRARTGRGMTWWWALGEYRVRVQTRDAMGTHVGCLWGWRDSFATVLQNPSRCVVRVGGRMRGVRVRVRGRVRGRVRVRVRKRWWWRVDVYRGNPRALSRARPALAVIWRDGYGDRGPMTGPVVDVRILGVCKVGCVEGRRRALDVHVGRQGQEGRLRLMRGTVLWWQLGGWIGRGRGRGTYGTAVGGRRVGRVRSHDNW